MYDIFRNVHVFNVNYKVTLPIWLTFKYGTKIVVNIVVSW
jgi:hypothetical protein